MATLTKIICCALVLAACSKPKAVEQRAAAPVAQPAPLDVRQRTGLLFTYLDSAGAVASTEKIVDIPEDRRQNVRVIELSLPPEPRGAGKFVYIADLRKANADGGYPYQVQSQVRFEQSTAGQAMREKVADAMAQSKDRVTVYTTSWCGVCSRAKAFLREKNVAFVERDVEQDPSAQAELAEKAKRAGVQPQGVPVIDVYGQLMLGFDEARLLQLLGRGGKTPVETL
jgi:glutaredoxin